VWVKTRVVLGLAGALSALPACSPLEDPSLFPEFSSAEAKLAPHKTLVAHNPNGNVFWGDLHIHTSLSSDAYTNGVRSTPDDA
jgi:hypothetical protein